MLINLPWEEGKSEGKLWNDCWRKLLFLGLCSIKVNWCSFDFSSLFHVRRTATSFVIQRVSLKLLRSFWCLIFDSFFELPKDTKYLWTQKSCFHRDAFNIMKYYSISPSSCGVCKQNRGKWFRAKNTKFRGENSFHYPKSFFAFHFRDSHAISLCAGKIAPAGLCRKMLLSSVALPFGHTLTLKSERSTCCGNSLEFFSDQCKNRNSEAWKESNWM